MKRGYGVLWVVIVILAWTVGIARTQVVCEDVGDFSTNTSTSVDSEAVLFSGASGKLGKRATGSGPAQLSSGVLTATTGANQIFLNAKLPPYNATGDGTTDDTTAIQTALNDAQVLNTIDTDNGGGIVHLPPGRYKITSLTIPKTVMLQGSNMFHGTALRQVNGVNTDAVKLKCADGDGWYYGGIRHITLQKETPVTDTLGSGIGTTRTSGTCALGEATRIDDIYVAHFPVSGIQVPNGSAPLRITHISAFYNGQYGVDLRGQHQTVLLDSISGDNNDIALINVDGTGSTYDATTIHIRNVKAETKQAALGGSPQETVVLLKELSNARVTIENISATRGGNGLQDPQELVRLQGTRPLITRLVDPACSGCVNMFVDETGSFTLDWSNDVQDLKYRENGHFQVEGRNGYAMKNLTIGSQQAPVAYTFASGLLTQQANANDVVMQTLRRLSTGGSFVKYQNADGLQTFWDVDIGGTLVAGTIPETRLVPQALDQADTGSISLDCSLYNYARIDELSQTTTFNAPITCTPTEGQSLSLAIFSTSARTLSFATGTGGFSNAYGVALPTTSFAGQWVFYTFKWNATVARWVIVTATR